MMAFVANVNQEMAQAWRILNFGHYLLLSVDASFNLVLAV
jgi:hypothetical protein